MEDVQKKIISGPREVIDPTPKQDVLVFVATPNTNIVEAATHQCINDLCVHFSAAKYEHGLKSVIARQTACSLITIGRHRLVEMATKMGATHMLWVDSDMTFPSDALHYLLRHGKSIVGCNYPRKTYPHMPTAAVGHDNLLYPEYTETENGDIDLVEPSEPLKQVMHLGFGLCLVHMEVYTVVEEKCGLPFFMVEPIFKNGVYSGDYGEDNYFFRKCREAGYDVWCDQQLSNMVGHEGRVNFDLTYSARSKSMEDHDELYKLPPDTLRRIAS